MGREQFGGENGLARALPGVMPSQTEDPLPHVGQPPDLVAAFDDRDEKKLY